MLDEFGLSTPALDRLASIVRGADTARLDLAPEGVSKGSALEIVRRTLRVEPGRTFAAGDQRNDLEMLRWAARGVAMGDAPDEVGESLAARRAAGSNPVVGSSRKTSSGSPTSASARSRRRSWPPESRRERTSAEAVIGRRHRADGDGDAVREIHHAS